MTWLPGYEHDHELGAGHNPLPGRRKVIVHTTETGPGSFAAVRNMWRGGPDNWAKGLPHFLAEGDRYVQLLPLTTCAYTSRGGPDACNKAGTPIQVEVVHRAVEPFAPVEYEAMGRWVADLMRAGIDLNLDECPRFYGDHEGVTLAVESSPVRQIITRDFGSFAEFNGICGHQHLRGNDHWDPGHLDVERVCHIARQHMGAFPPEHGDEIDMATPAEIIEPIAEHVAAAVFDLAGKLERARVSVIVADTQNTENLAAVVRGESGATRDSVRAALAEMDDAGELPDGLDLDAVADKVAGRLAVTTKP